MGKDDFQDFPETAFGLVGVEHGRTVGPGRFSDVSPCQVVLMRVLLTSWPAASRLLLVVCDPLCGTLSFALTWVAERSGTP